MYYTVYTNNSYFLLFDKVDITLIPGSNDGEYYNITPVLVTVSSGLNASSNLNYTFEIEVINCNLEIVKNPSGNSSDIYRFVMTETP